MTSTLTETAVPTGTWTLDRLHSTVSYAVRHQGVGLFRGGLAEFEAELVDGTLRGAADVKSVTIDDENLVGHLLSPEFFDAERFPQVSFTSTSISRSGDELTVEGELEIRGEQRPVTLTGTIFGPVGEKIGISLAATIDRTSFGMNWQMELPGGVDALGNDVTLTADLELAKAQA